jgi:hypothetical protein
MRQRSWAQWTAPQFRNVIQWEAISYQVELISRPTRKCKRALLPLEIPCTEHRSSSICEEKGKVPFSSRFTQPSPPKPNLRIVIVTDQKIRRKTQPLGGGNQVGTIRSPPALRRLPAHASIRTVLKSEPLTLSAPRDSHCRRDRYFS